VGWETGREYERGENELWVKYLKNLKGELESLTKERDKLKSKNKSLDEN